MTPYLVKKRLSGHHLTGVTEIIRHEWGAGSGEAGPWDRACSDSDLLGAMVPSSYYEIRVVGVLPSEALLDFDRLTASVEPVETIVHGQLQDQAALQGLLARLEAFGVQVLEVRRLYLQDPPVGEDRPD